MNNNENVNRAEQIIKGEAPWPEPEAFKDLIHELKGDLQFGPARKLLSKAREKAPDDVWIAQQLASCTYQDEELLPAQRFSQALELLEQIGLRDPATDDADTLAIGGDVHKRLWEFNGQLEHLYEALGYYRAAFERNPRQDRGYGGVNAAFLLDVLAARAETIAQRSQAASVEAPELRQKAKQLREQMADAVPRAAEENPALHEQYGYVAILAEIYFGLKNYEEAARRLAKAAQLSAKEWALQTTFRHLVTLAHLQGIELPKEGSDPSGWHPAWRALSELLGEGTERALSCYLGKIGLALSGGGFRASFFHLGVLARLAEMDALRGVEVLSTVSGGSIAGAHYYLEVKKLLESKSDEAITRDDYLEIVRRLQDEFLRGVQRNLRTRALENFLKNVKMIFFRTYTRSHRMGELYEKEIYARVQDGHDPDQPRSMPELLIRPLGDLHRDHFKPKFHNWRRRAKVPILLLNTTSLNSGHGWHFTASWLGEPPGLMGLELDVNERYRRLYYWQAPKDRPDLQNYRLGHAVAASACVPGLFQPLVIEGLYPERTVRLVDGGVHDNQGVAGLLDERCRFVLGSDASGQMDDMTNPSDGLIGVLSRSSSVLMDRVREAVYQNLTGRKDSRALQGLFFVHTKQDLTSPPLDWIDAQNSTPPPLPTGHLTAYGVDKAIQAQLAAIRTDLDSFTEVEAYSLMLSGYLMTEHEFKELQKQHQKDGQTGTWGGCDILASRGDWPFLQLEEVFKLPEDSQDPRRQDLGFQLEVAKERFFKAWRLVPELRRAVYLIVAITLALLAILIWAIWDKPLWGASMTWGQVVLMLAIALAGLLVPAIKWLFPEQAKQGYIRKAAVALSGYVVAKVHLWLIEPKFLERGQLKRLLGLGEKS